jgi:hypothetical protein
MGPSRLSIVVLSIIRRFPPGARSKDDLAEVKNDLRLNNDQPR